MSRPRHLKARDPGQEERVEFPLPDIRLHACVAFVIGLLCFAIYLTSLRAGPSWDTIPSRLLPFSILREGNLDLDEFGWLYRIPPPPYFLRRTPDGHWISAYPIATSLVGTPVAIPAIWWLEKHGIPDDDVRFRVVTIVTERITAALITAASVAILFLSLARLTSTNTAVVMSLVYALGTNTWATSSQVLWQHGLVELSLASLSFCLLGSDTRRNAVGASAFAALGVMARPTMVIFALLALSCMWRSRRKNLPYFLILPVVGAVILLAYNIRLAGGVAGAYGTKYFTLPSLSYLVGMLVSPSRGLLIYTPFAALAAWGIWYRRNDRRGWLPHLAVGIGAYLLLYSSYDGWPGGSVYGPRMLVDLMPAVMLCAVPAVERLVSSRTGRVAFAAMALWGVAVQAIGVFFDDDRWNNSPDNAHVDVQRVWDWRDPQILRATRTGWHGTDLAHVLWQTFTDPRSVLLRPLAASDLAGEISSADDLPQRLRCAGLELVRVVVTNRSDTLWPAFSDHGHLECKVGYRWWQDGELLQESGAIPLPRNLGPGESVEVRGWVGIPDRSGRVELEFVLVQVLDEYRGKFGGTSLRIPVEIE